MSDSSEEIDEIHSPCVQGWRRIWTYPRPDGYSNAVPINEKEFILFINFAIKKYSIKDQSWSDLYKHLEIFNSSQNSIALNEDKRLLYLYNSDCKVTIIDLKSKGFMQTQAKTKYNGSYCSSLVIN